MSSSLIHGKYIIGRVIDNDRAEVIENGAIFQRDGKIVEIGAYEDLSGRHQPDEVLGDGSHVVVPGFVNAHHHVGVTPVQLGCPDSPLELWIPHRLAARSVDPYLDTLYSAFEMIESGVTTVQHLNTHCFGPVEPCAKNAEAILRAYRDIGMRVSFSFLIHDQNHLVYEADDEFVKRLPDELGRRMSEFLATLHITAEDQLQLFEDMHARYSGDPFTRIQLAPANLHWNSDSLLEKFAEYSERFDVPMHMHLVETAYQKEYARRRTDSTAVQHLHKFDLLGGKMTLGHGVWLTDTDMDLIAETGTNVCHCPSSNLRLRSGIAPVNQLAERGIRIAIGIDEAGINDDRDMLQEMRLALNLHRREPGHDTVVPTHCQLLRMATENSAMTTPFGAEIGVLEPGRAADMTLMRWEQIAAPYLDAEVPVVRALLHRAKTSCVDTVIVGGKPVYRDGRFTRVDKEAVLEELAASLSGPRTSVEEQRRQIARDVYGHVEAFYRDYLG
ncbi:MAG: amidohydrolase family protein [Gammaproteobacteria bacterium]|nr:amidohydrolase family protein [Gammaproteobacteria bacterium]